MALMRTVLVTILLGACATARMEPTGGDQAQPDAGSGTPRADARVDAPQQSGTADAPSTGGCANVVSGTLATWDFAAQPGNQASTPVKTTATGVVAGAIERSAALTAVSGANAINSSNWPTAAQPDPTKHYKLTLAPPSGCSLSITAIAIDARASTTGPAMAAVASSVDTYASNVTISTAAASAPVMSVVNQTGTVEVHVLGYSATGTAGTLRLQGVLTVSGSLQ
jgi:hypothetical protein